MRRKRWFALIGAFWLGLTLSGCKNTCGCCGSGCKGPWSRNKVAKAEGQQSGWDEKAKIAQSKPVTTPVVPGGVPQTTTPVVISPETIPSKPLTTMKPLPTSPTQQGYPNPLEALPPEAAETSSQEMPTAPSIQEIIPPPPPVVPAQVAPPMTPVAPTAPVAPPVQEVKPVEIPAPSAIPPLSMPAPPPPPPALERKSVPLPTEINDPIAPPAPAAPPMLPPPGQPETSAAPIEVPTELPPPPLPDQAPPPLPPG